MDSTWRSETEPVGFESATKQHIRVKHIVRFLCPDNKLLTRDRIISCEDSTLGSITEPLRSDQVITEMIASRAKVQAQENVRKMAVVTG